METGVREVSERAACLWCREVPVAGLVVVCADCLDRRVRELGQAIRVHATAGVKLENCPRVQPHLAERNRVLRLMTRERQRYWAFVLTGTPTVRPGSGRRPRAAVGAAVGAESEASSA